MKPVRMSLQLPEVGINPTPFTFTFANREDVPKMDGSLTQLELILGGSEM